MPKRIAKRILEGIRRAEPKVDGLLAFLSMVAIALVVSNEFVSHDLTIPYLNQSWSATQVFLRTIIWLVFVTSFALYALVSGRPMTYLRKHIAEFLVCVCWVPHYTSGSALVNDFLLSRVVPLDVLQLLGTLAHAWRVVRHTTERFSSHPLIVAGSAAMLLICSTAALLTHFEPQTFPTFWDAAWFALTTVTTIGYGDLTPHTAIGRIITTFLIIGGISLFGLVLGLISEMARSKLLKNTPDGQMRVLMANVERLNRELSEARESIAELKAQNEQSHQLLNELLRQRSFTQPTQEHTAPSEGPQEPTPDA